MDSDKRRQIIGALLDNVNSTLALKGVDYEVNKNFFDIGALTGLHPLTVWRVLRAKHEVAIEKQMNDFIAGRKERGAEDIKERVVDLIAYDAILPTLIMDIEERRQDEITLAKCVSKAAVSEAAAARAANNYRIPAEPKAYRTMLCNGRLTRLCRDCDIKDSCSIWTGRENGDCDVDESNADKSNADKSNACNADRPLESVEPIVEKGLKKIIETPIVVFCAVINKPISRKVCHDCDSVETCAPRVVA